MKPLEGSKAIADLLGTTARRVKTYVKNGAPIRTVGAGRSTRYLADREVVLKWVRCEVKKP